MGLCQSRHSRSSLNSALIGDLEYDGGDDYKKVETDDEDAPRSSGICCCRPGGCCDDDLLDFDEFDVEHQDEITPFHEMTEEQETTAFGYGDKSRHGDGGMHGGGNRSDDRIRVDIHQRPIAASTAQTCQIRSMTSEYANSYGQGTGIILTWNIDGEDITFVMTCAHNFVDNKEAANGNAKHKSNITCYTFRQDNQYAEEYKVIKSFVHPAYRGDPSSGFDYCIGVLALKSRGGIQAPSESEKDDDYFMATVDQNMEQRIFGKTGMVRGYPGSWKNTMCTMNGNFLKTLTRRRGQYTGRAIVYDIDQSPGNSGGPVFAVDPSAVRALKESTFTQEEDNDDTKCLIGIVTGMTTMQNSYTGQKSFDNYGTLLTPQIIQWTMDKLAQSKGLSKQYVPDSGPTSGGGGGGGGGRRGGARRGNFNPDPYAGLPPEIAAQLRAMEGDLQKWQSLDPSGRMQAGGGNPKSNFRKSMFRVVYKTVSSMYGTKYEGVTQSGQKVTFTEQEWNNLPY